MRIHSDILTETDIERSTSAMGMRGVYTEKLETRGSRSRARSFDVKLSGRSGRWTNSGTSGAETGNRAATWDEWGMFIGALFAIDPLAIIGMYPDGKTFHEVTFDRFTALTGPYQHGNHKWVYDKLSGAQMCRDCEAQFDHLKLAAARKARKS